MQESAFSFYLSKPDRDRVLYVDAVNGDDGNRGNVITSPAKTLTYALSRATNNSLIVLQNGSYGSVVLDRTDLKIIGAYGSNPVISSITATNCSVNLYNLNFSGASGGVSVINTSVNKGAVSIRKCLFSSIDSAIFLTRCRSISIHQNKFVSCSMPVMISNAEQAAISANSVDNADQAFAIASVNQLDLFLNTVDRSNALGSTVVPGAEIHVLFHTLTAQDILNKYLIMPSYLLHVAINVVYGPSFGLYTDFIFNGNLVLWEGLGLDGQLVEGDILRVIYSRTNPPATGSAILLTSIGSGSRIDSNNITNANLGVFLSSNIKITNNNFFSTTTPFDGAVPLVDIGNIVLDPKYVDGTPGSANFHLQANSASIGKSNPNRWEEVFSEMSGKWGSVSFNRNLDYDGINRFYVGKTTGDIGSYEFITGSYATGLAYVGENGYDFSYFGKQDKPFYTPDRAFSQAGTDPVALSVGSATGLLRSNTGRFTINDLELSNSNLIIGSNRSRDYAIWYPTYPMLSTTDNVYVSEDTGTTGDGSYSSPYKNIDEALAEIGKSNVILLPGRHKKFTNGVSGKRIIPLKVVETTLSTKKVYTQFNSPGWGVSTTGSISPVLETKSLTFDYITSTGLADGSADVSSVFNLANNSDGVDVKFKVLIGTNLDVELYTTPASTVLVPPNYPTGTPDNALFFNMVGTDLSIGYRKLTVEDSTQKQLSFPTTYSLVVFELTVQFLIQGSSFKIWVKGDSLDLYKEGSFESLYDGAHSWKVKFSSSLSTAIAPSNVSTISNLKVVAGDIVGGTNIGSYPDSVLVGKGPSILAGS